MKTIENMNMYLRYYWKNVYLQYLKFYKHLDFVGRIENPDERLRGYEGCYPVNKILKTFCITEQDAILDIGCGKGLFLLYAKGFKFSRIDGIEYSEELVRYSKENINKFQDSRIGVLLADARTFRDYCKYNYFFFNNPFGREIMEDVVISIVNSYSCNPRKITVIYQFPFSISVFEKHGFKTIYYKQPNAVLTLG